VKKTPARNKKKDSAIQKETPDPVVEGEEGSDHSEEESDRFDGDAAGADIVAIEAAKKLLGIPCDDGGKGKNEEMTGDNEPKQRGRKKGATRYSVGDLTACLDAAEEILPIQDKDWTSVAEHYKEKYSLKFGRPDRSSLSLKTHYRELLWGELSGGGERTELQGRAKAIEKLILEKAGCDRGGDPPTTSSSSSGEAPATPSPRRSSTRMGFESKILGHLQDSEAAQDKRHSEKLDLFQQLINKL
jgi:hypothetical protein